MFWLICKREPHNYNNGGCTMYSVKQHWFSNKSINKLLLLAPRVRIYYLQITSGRPAARGYTGIAYPERRVNEHYVGWHTAVCWTIASYMASVVFPVNTISTCSQRHISNTWLFFKYINYNILSVTKIVRIIRERVPTVTSIRRPTRDAVPVIKWRW